MASFFVLTLFIQQLLSLSLSLSLSRSGLAEEEGPTLNPVFTNTDRQMLHSVPLSFLNFAFSLFSVESQATMS